MEAKPSVRHALDVHIYERDSFKEAGMFRIEDSRPKNLRLFLERGGRAKNGFWTFFFGFLYQNIRSSRCSSVTASRRRPICDADALIVFFRK